MSNTKADWPTLRREYIEGGMSIRELAMTYNVPTSTVIARAKADGWQEEREKFRKGVAVGTLQALIDGQAEKLVAARDEAIDALRIGLARSISDMQATRPTKVVTALDDEGNPSEWEIREEPVMRVPPRDLVILIDKVAMLSGQPTMISRVESESNVHITAAIEQLSAADLLVLAERAGDGLTDGGSAQGSPLPRLADPDPATNGS